MQLAGTGLLVRLVVRRDRVRLVVWLVSIVGLVYAQAASIEGLYSPEELMNAARLVEGNAAFVAMAGPALNVDTLGGRTTFEISAFAMVMAALMNIFLVTRHLRAEEESGRVELVRAGTVGRHAPGAAALLVAAAADVVLGVSLAASLAPFPMPAAGIWALSIGIAGVGLVFAGIACVTSQLTTGARAASGLAGGALAAAFVVRAIGDIGSGTLSWLSPMGWGQSLRPFADERWWPVALLVGGTAALGLAGFAVTSRRDLGAGIVQPGPGAPRASARLGGPLGLAFRLHRASLLWWAVSLFLGGVAYGSVGGDVEDFIGDNELIADLMVQGGTNLLDGFLATTSLVLAVVAGGFTVQAALRLHGEEEAGRAEPVLGAAVSRWRFVASHLVVVAAGSVVVLAAGGLGNGITFALVAGDGGDVPRLVWAAVVYAPALLVLAGVVVVLYGLLPRLSALSWAVLTAWFVVGYLGDVLSLPDPVQQLSPFEHVPRLPAVPFDVVPIAVLLAVAAALVRVGDAGFRHRDLAA